MVVCWLRWVMAVNCGSTDTPGWIPHAPMAAREMAQPCKVNHALNVMAPPSGQNGALGTLVAPWAEAALMTNKTVSALALFVSTIVEVPVAMERTWKRNKEFSSPSPSEITF